MLSGEAHPSSTLDARPRSALAERCRSTPTERARVCLSERDSDGVCRIAVCLMLVLGVAHGCVLTGEYDFDRKSAPARGTATPAIRTEPLARVSLVTTFMPSAVGCRTDAATYWIAGRVPMRLFCGGAGPNRCGALPCSPRTCADFDATCGLLSDGCGETLNCGECAAPQTCGGGSFARKCGCTPKSCSSLGVECGTVDDGCGKQLDCGACQAPKTCSQAGRCECSPKTCDELGATCGKLPDGCGGELDCKSCPTGQVCGAGGRNRCGTGPCTPKTCAEQGAECGQVSDGLRR